MAVIDELVAMQVFYVNIGGGEPMLRPDFFDIVGYAVDHRVGVKFSTNGTRIDPDSASGSRRWTTSTSRSAWTDPPPPSTTGSAAGGATPPRVGPWTTWPAPGSARSS